MTWLRYRFWIAAMEVARIVFGFGSGPYREAAARAMTAEYQLDEHGRGK